MLAIARAKFATGKLDLFLTFSTACNYTCVFCNRDGVKKIVRIEDLGIDLDALVNRARSVDITGYGEPTLHPEFDDIVHRLGARRVPLRFVTNGSRLTTDRVDLLRSVPIKEIVVSLNSLDPTTYRELHGRNADFDLVVTNTKDLLARRNFPVAISMVLTSRNLEDIPRLIEFSRVHRPTSLAVLGLTPTIQHLYPPGLTVDDTPAHRSFLADMRQYAIREGVNILLPDLGNQATANAPVPPDRLRAMIRSCDWVYTKMFVSETGGVAPCCWSRMNMGDLTKQSFEEVWQGDRYRELRQAVRRGYHPECANCRRLN